MKVINGKGNDCFPEDSTGSTRTSTLTGTEWILQGNILAIESSPGAFLLFSESQYVLATAHKHFQRNIKLMR